MPEKSSLPPPANCDSLLQALSVTSDVVGLKTPAMEDATGARLNYFQLWLKLHMLGEALDKELGTQQRVGVLLPTSVVAAVTFFGLHRVGRIPVMLNFSAGLAANQSAIKITELDYIITSRTFVAKANLEDFASTIGKTTNIIYLEDISKRISKLKALAALPKLLMGVPADWVPDTNPEAPAVILFTSGSEGVPKGVVLSHRNLLSNMAQVKEHLEFSASDKMFNKLPVFHSFGLTVGTLLPPILGFPVYFYPSPLQYKQIPPLVRETGATIFPSTDTFLRGYASQAGADDFAGLRMVVAGAERLKPATTELYKEKFGIDIIQGYGVTETSPVASANTPENNVTDSVGTLLPHMEARVEPVEGIEEGGELHLKGPNVMLGYMKDEKPGVLQPAGQWYNTGDVVRMDGDRIFITGRLKRFAKIGGEMVSLAVVEEIAFEASPDAAHAAVTIADERKGEQIVLLTEDAGLSREQLIAAGKKLDAAELYIPKKVQAVDEVPRLGNGKINYIAAKKLVEQRAQCDTPINQPEAVNQ